MRVHQAQPLSRQEFDVLTRVVASKSGLHSGFCEAPSDSENEDDFRSESDFEARVGLLKSSLVFCDGELCLTVSEDCFFQKLNGINPYLQSTVDLFERAAFLCKKAGSHLVRQQAMRNNEAKITSKAFQPVTFKTSQRYANLVAHFAYFCSKIQWDVVGCMGSKNATQCLLDVLFERNRTISQTFIARFVTLFLYM